VEIFIVAFFAFVIGLILIVLLKKTSPPPPQELIQFDEIGGKPAFLTDRDAFKEKCLEFLGKFNLEYQHSIWANDQELEIDMQDETPVVGGKYLALCILDPPNNTVDSIKVSGFIDIQSFGFFLYLVFQLDGFCGDILVYFFEFLLGAGVL